MRAKRVKFQVTNAATCGYMRLHAATCGYMRLHAATRGYMLFYIVFFKKSLRKLVSIITFLNLNELGPDFARITDSTPSRVMYN